MNGIYLLAKSLRTGIIAIHQLPRTPDTLWLRILGRGKVQQQALQELEALPKDNTERSNTIEIVADFLAALRQQENQNEEIDEDERSLIMQLSTIYTEQIEQAKQEGRQQGRQEGWQEGRQQGLQQGRQELRKNSLVFIPLMLKYRFGSIDAELEAIIEPLTELLSKEGIQQGSAGERRSVIQSLLQYCFGSIDTELEAIIEPLTELPLRESLPLLIQLSREELLNRFGNLDGD